MSSGRTFHRAGITREERKPVNNDFSGGVDAPEKRTAYAFTNFFQDKEDMPVSRATIYPRLPLFGSNMFTVRVTLIHRSIFAFVMRTNCLLYMYINIIISR